MAAVVILPEPHELDDRHPLGDRYPGGRPRRSRRSHLSLVPAPEHDGGAVAAPGPAAAPVPGYAVRRAPEVYRRRRLVALVLAVTAVALALSAGRALTTAEVATTPVPAAVALAPGTMDYVVQPGDSIWSLAEQLRPGGDPRPVVDELVARNGGRSTLVTGQHLDLAGLIG